MAASEENGSTDNPLVALGKQAALPIVGASRDIGLGFAHRTALDIARNILSDISKQELSNLYVEIMGVFSEWKAQHGQPPAPGLLGLLTCAKEGELSEKDRLKQIKDLLPWQCHPYAKTPIALFKALFGSDYKPLKVFLNNGNWHRMPKIQALLIIDSHNPESVYQSSDCIHAAMDLAHWELESKEKFINTLLPDAHAAFKRRQRKKAQAEAQKEKTARIVEKAYQICTDSGKKFNNQTVVWQIKETFNEDISEATVSRHLRAMGVTKYKKSCTVEA